MLWLVVTNLAKEFDLHSRFGSVVLEVIVVGRLAGVSLSEHWDYNPLLEFYLMIFIASA